MVDQSHIDYMVKWEESKEKKERKEFSSNNWSNLYIYAIITVINLMTEVILGGIV